MGRLLLVTLALGGCCLAPTQAPAPPPPVAPESPPPEAPDEPDPLTTAVMTEGDALAALEGDALTVALDDWSATATDTTFAMAERGGHIGERVVYDGTIEEIAEINGGTTLIFNTGRDEDWFVAARNVEEHLVEGSRARLYGYLTGRYPLDSGEVMQAIIGVACVPRDVPRHASEAMRRRLSGEVAPTRDPAPRAAAVPDPEPEQREAVITPVPLPEDLDEEAPVRQARLIVDTFGTPARVIVDEQEVGRTPYSRTIGDGSHTIDLVTADGQTYSTTRDVECCNTYRVSHRFD